MSTEIKNQPRRFTVRPLIGEGETLWGLFDQHLVLVTYSRADLARVMAERLEQAERARVAAL